jgi:hypothetical protein
MIKTFVVNLFEMCQLLLFGLDQLQSHHDSALSARSILDLTSILRLPINRDIIHWKAMLLIRYPPLSYQRSMDSSTQICSEGANVAARYSLNLSTKLSTSNHRYFSELMPSGRTSGYSLRSHVPNQNIESVSRHAGFTKGWNRHILPWDRRC